MAGTHGHFHFHHALSESLEEEDADDDDEAVPTTVLGARLTTTFDKEVCFNRLGLLPSHVLALFESQRTLRFPTKCPTSMVNSDQSVATNDGSKEST